MRALPPASTRLIIGGFTLVSFARVAAAAPCSGLATDPAGAVLYCAPTITTGNNGHETSTAILPSCGATGGVFISSQSHTAARDKFASLGSNLTAGSVIFTQEPPGTVAIANPGDCAMGQLCSTCVGNASAPLYSAASTINLGLTGSDSQLVRIGDTTVLYEGVLPEQVPDPTTQCTSTIGAANAPTWGVVRSTSDCGANWSTNVALTGKATDPAIISSPNPAALQFGNGWDGASLYADPFTLTSSLVAPGNFATVYVVASIEGPGNLGQIGDRVWRSDDGAVNWTTVAKTQTSTGSEHGCPLWCNFAMLSDNA